MPTSSTNPCQLLSLPIELRLEIYNYLVHSSDIVTIGTAELHGAHHEIIHRQYASGKSPAKGIPPGHEHLIVNGYNANLLHPTRPAKIHLPRFNQDEDDSITATTHLRLVCRQTARELAQHFPPNPRPSHLFLSYPYGLHILHSRHPSLLQQARTIHLTGVYRPTDYSPARAATCPSPPHQRTLDGNSNSKPILEPSDITTELSHLLTTIFPPPTDTTTPTSPHHDHPSPPALSNPHLHLRIHYPGADSYSTIWGDEASPIVLALRGIPYGEIKLEIWRGKCGNGVDLRVGGDGGRGEGDEEVEEELGEWMRRRVVQSNWKRMEGEEREQEGGGEGGGGRGGILPAWADWVVDPRWPEGGEEGEDEQEGGRV
ncbi:hypothetical protein KC343_g11688 [Hortaea werneckii]|uniref:Uncharacterized protein n=1 Tax=Hortaea werneckii TaxID=91943 RepID=A0A3M7GWJ9_HORWE|nr:hypothetical protein KC323_g2655 [Hortaea werneckii]KAI6871675.1 hypothetical protein KC338_g2497 [Hortaea werneckii]KAI7356159.1 hypothetical protein KC320_g2398 [Hortaea werneckii]KAI7604209.1 hypothetical protein KC346_g11561 [Hortaea werneckii]KAI7611078.1 hypothetical protein KC343_g11688 [Hortaea werneckii]